MVKLKKTDKKQLKDLEISEIQKLKKLTSSTEFLLKVIGDVSQIKRFNQLPLSAKTIAGLENGHFMEMTPIQKDSLLYSLCGRDILGAAKTGSGKTLAFLIPVLEKLFLEGWTSRDGLGALILSPTRELALQIFEVLRKIGIKHSFSAGLVIGGKDLKIEREAINRMNILVATPGRLLQHMDQTTGFDWNNLQILVLDEADRILDMGFAKTVDAIVENLPRDRQTLLFSATQTSSVKDLARLSLQNPHQVSLFTADDDVTPAKLKQHYVITSLPEKLDRLFSFIKANVNAKALVFLSSCKQVRFVYETFCKLQPGVPLLCLHGKQKQIKRMSVFYEFVQKKSAIMFATDIAARGLDFPAVDWVVQVDCPEDAQTYIHRVGRTARYESDGSALLFLLPSEESEMLESLKKNKIPIARMNGENRTVKPRWNLTGHLQGQCSQDPEIKYLGQKALVSYVRSVHLQRNKKVFKVAELPLDEFARSLGLPGTPKLRFVSRAAEKNASRQLAALEKGQVKAKEEEISESSSSEEEQESQDEEIDNKTSKQERKIDKMFKKRNLNVLSEHYAKLRADEGETGENDEEDLFTIKRRDHEIREEDIPMPAGPSVTSRRDILKTKKRYRLKTAEGPKRFVFDDEGDAEEAFPYEKEEKFDKSQAGEMAAEYLAESMVKMEEADAEDKAAERDKRRTKRAEKKRKLRAREEEEREDEGVQLAGSDDEEYGSDDE